MVLAINVNLYVVCSEPQKYILQLMTGAGVAVAMLVESEIRVSLSLMGAAQQESFLSDFM